VELTTEQKKMLTDSQSGTVQIQLSSGTIVTKWPYEAAARNQDSCQIVQGAVTTARTRRMRSTPAAACLRIEEPH